MKKIKVIKFQDGTEGYSHGNIKIEVKGNPTVSEIEVEVDDQEAAKILDEPKKYKLENKKAVKRIKKKQKKL